MLDLVQSLLCHKENEINEKEKDNQLIKNLNEKIEEVKKLQMIQKHLKFKSKKEHHKHIDVNFSNKLINIQDDK